MRTTKPENRSVPEELWTEVPAAKVRSKVFHILIFAATLPKNKQTKKNLRAGLLVELVTFKGGLDSLKMKPPPTEKERQSLEVSDCSSVFWGKLLPH